MSIVNCKVKYIRPKYNNLKEWMNNENNIYIGRKNVVFIDNMRFPQNSSNFANPYKIGKDGTRDEILLKYRDFIVNKLNNNKNLIDELILLHLWTFKTPTFAFKMSKGVNRFFKLSH